MRKNIALALIASIFLALSPVFIPALATMIASKAYDEYSESNDTQKERQYTGVDYGMKTYFTTGKLGECGDELVIEAGTMDSGRGVGYYIPKGTFEVTNHGSDSIMIGFSYVVPDFEFWVEGETETLEPNETRKFSSEYVAYVVTYAPCHIAFKQIGD